MLQVNRFGHGRIPVQTQIAQGDGTAIGNMTGQGGLAASFNGTVDDSLNCSFKVGGTDNGVDPKVGGYIGKDWGAGVDKTISGFKIWGPTDSWINNQTTSSTITVELQGSNDNFSSDVNDLGSVSFTDANGGASGEKLTGLTATAYRYHRLKIQSSGTFSGGGCRCAEVQFFEDV